MTMIGFYTLTFIQTKKYVDKKGKAMEDVVVFVRENSSRSE
jgi:hypothetical protein